MAWIDEVSNGDNIDKPGECHPEFLTHIFVMFLFCETFYLFEY